MGIQSFKAYLKLFNFIPVYVEQIFYNKKKNYNLFYKNHSLKEIDNKNIKKFGDSIHYCNMKINGVTINKFFSKIHKNLLGFGMSFVDQKTPGPISNDIILSIKNKLK